MKNGAFQRLNITLRSSGRSGLLIFFRLRYIKNLLKHSLTMHRMLWKVLPFTASCIGVRAWTTLWKNKGLMRIRPMDYYLQVFKPVCHRLLQHFALAEDVELCVPQRQTVFLQRHQSLSWTGLHLGFRGSVQAFKRFVASLCSWMARSLLCWQLDTDQHALEAWLQTGQYQIGQAHQAIQWIWHEYSAKPESSNCRLSAVLLLPVIVCQALRWRNTISIGTALSQWCLCGTTSIVIVKCLQAHGAEVS